MRSSPMFINTFRILLIFHPPCTRVPRIVYRSAMLEWWHHHWSPIKQFHKCLQSMCVNKQSHTMILTLHGCSALLCRMLVVVCGADAFLRITFVSFTAFSSSSSFSLSVVSTWSCPIVNVTFWPELSIYIIIHSQMLTTFIHCVREMVIL
jgi:hypothetical protein